MSGTVLELTRADIWRSLLEQLPTAVYLLDTDQKIVFWNLGAERITGRLSQDVVGRLTRGQLLTRGDGPASNDSPPDAAVQSALRDGKCSEADTFLNHKDGHTVGVSLRTFAVRDPKGHILGIAESFEESIAASEWDRRKSKLASYGCLDEATGALTRDFAETHLRERLCTFNTHPIPFAIFCVQGDVLEHVRAKYGSRVAQNILRLISQTLEHSVRPHDIVGHWSQDEFLILLAECSRLDIEKVGKRLHKMLSNAEIKWWGDSIRVQVSLGGTTAFPGDTIESLLQRAHQAMCTSISAGGNRMTILEV